jgi:hypothetical protein
MYLKTSEQMPRPTDPEFFWLTRDGPFFCRNHAFFQSDVPARRPPRALALHSPACQVHYPKLSVGALEYIIGFFDKVYQRHFSESVVLLLWNLERQRYKLWVPDQEATVWESYSGVRSPVDVRYNLPVPLPVGHLLVGDIHCHGDMGAYASFTDRRDERYRDGVHAIVGRIDRDPPDFHLELAVDGYRFPLKFEQIFRGYHRRRRHIPEQWMSQVKIKLECSIWSPWSSQSYKPVSNGWSGRRKEERRD